MGGMQFEAESNQTGDEDTAFRHWSVQIERPHASIWSGGGDDGVLPHGQKKHCCAAMVRNCGCSTTKGFIGDEW